MTCTGSPGRTRPGTTTRALSPRSRIGRPTVPLTKRIASAPKRSTNLAQPVCGGAVTSMTAPRTRRVTDGEPAADRQVVLREVEVEVELVAREGPTRRVAREERRPSGALMTLSCISGCGPPSAVRLLPRCGHESPTSPSSRSSSPSSSTSRSPGRRSAHDQLEGADVARGGEQLRQEGLELLGGAVRVRLRVGLLGGLLGGLGGDVDGGHGDQCGATPARAHRPSTHRAPPPRRPATVTRPSARQAEAGPGRAARAGRPRRGEARHRSTWPASRPGASSAARGTGPGAVAQLLEDGAAHLPVGAVPRLPPPRLARRGPGGRRRPTRTGRPPGTRSHLGARAWQTRAPSSITATFQVADVGRVRRARSEAASADSAAVSAGAAKALPSTARASTRRTLVSTTVVRRPNAKAATAAAV